MNTDQLHELLYQALETEQGGILVYQNALRCVLNADLKRSGRNASTRRKITNVSSEIYLKLSTSTPR
jgi:hypothetical protein